MEILRATKIALIGLALVAVSAVPSMSFQPAAEEAENAESAVGGDADFDAVMAVGEELYANNCAACHGVDGTGPERAFPGNANLEYAVVIASQVIHGGEFMPRFPDLTDEDIAAIGTFIRNSWGNSMGPVTAEEIGEYR